MISTEQILIQKYGCLLSLTEAAEVMHRTADGLRLTIRGNSEFAKKMQSCRIRLGRRVLFKAVEIAKIIDGEDGEVNA